MSGIAVVIVLALSIGLVLLWLLGAAQDQQWGIPIKEERSINGITRLDFSGAGEIVIHQGEQEKLEIEGPLTAVARVQSKTKDHTLEISYQSLEWWNPLNWFRRAQPPLRYILTVKDLKALHLHGSSQVVISSLMTKELSIDLEGSSNIKIDQLRADVLRIEIAGAGQVQLTGEVQKHNIIVTGTVTYQTAGLQSEETYLQISGVGNVEVMTTKLLDVAITGSGTVTYTGNPEQVKQRISGTGSLIKK